MKLVVVILATVFSSFMKTSDPSTETVCGTWKGYYGTETEINSIIIKINPLYKAQIFYKEKEVVLKANATYRLLGDSAIVISYKLPNQQSSEVILHGNLNRTSSFIDGKWDGDGNQGGCFYLQKQFQEINY